MLASRCRHLHREDSCAGLWPGENQVPDITNVSAITDAKVATDAGDDGKAKKNAAKVPMEKAIWASARPAMQGLNEIADDFEMFGKCVTFLRRSKKSQY